MSARSATHGTFAIERIYDSSPARVFKAWADPAAKARWFVGPTDWQLLERAIDFRVGGKERLSGRKGSGIVSTFDAVYHDIVPNERIIFAYSMTVGEKRISSSLATVQFKPAGDGTQLVFTEQGAFLDGLDSVGPREAGWKDLLNALGRALKS